MMPRKISVKNFPHSNNSYEIEFATFRAVAKKTNTMAQNAQNPIVQFVPKDHLTEAFSLLQHSKGVSLQLQDSASWPPTKQGKSRMLTDNLL
jgi:hypothetical protein